MSNSANPSDQSHSTPAPSVLTGATTSPNTDTLASLNDDALRQCIKTYTATIWATYEGNWIQIRTNKTAPAMLTVPTTEVSRRLQQDLAHMLQEVGQHLGQQLEELDAVSTASGEALHQSVQEYGKSHLVLFSVGKRWTNERAWWMWDTERLRQGLLEFSRMLSEAYTRLCS
jgi:hypothetical protein